MDSIVSIVASFESFIFRNIPFTILLLLSTYFLIISVSVWFKNPNFKKTIVALLAVITLQTTYFITQKTYKEKEDFIVFNVWKKSAIGIKTNSELKLFTSDSINENYVVLPYKIANFVTKSNQKPLQSLYYFNHKKILIIDSEAFEIGENPDVLVLCKSPKLNLEKVLELIKPKQIVADGSNYKSYVKMWEKTCREQKIQFHNTSEMGFYRLEKK